MMSEVSHCEKRKCPLGPPLPAEKVPLQFHEQYIISGYRKPYTSAYDCIRSAFGPYNETFNFWTHFIPFLLFFARFAVLFSSSVDPYRYPLLAFAIGICGFLLMSSGAHLFNSMSPRVRHCCFFCDYSAISVYSVGAGMAFYFYSRPLDKASGVFPDPLLFISGSLAIALFSTYTCCASRHRWARYKYIIRTGSFIVVFLYNTFPYCCRFVLDSDSVNPEAMSYFKRHIIFYLIAAVANTTRMPERLIPGVFDVIGHSHNFLHVFAALGVSDQFTAMEIEMRHRELTLRQLHKDIYSQSLVIMFCALLANIAIVIWFGKNLKSNKDEEFKKVY